VIALALTLTAVVAFALTRGGDSNPGTEPNGKGETAMEPATSGPSTEPAALPACSTDPPASRPFPEPAESVPGATADYLFQSSLSSSLGTAPDLVPVEDGSSIFTVDGRTGTTVLRFAGGRGLALEPTTGVIPSTRYTIEVLFRLDLLSGYRKILDFKDGATDDGLYLQDGCLTFFPKDRSGTTSIESDTYVQVVFTRDGDGRVAGYVNGVRQFGFDDRGALAEVNAKSTLRFFVDDHTTTGEDSSGGVSQIRLFGEALTDSEVAALACSELAIADATQACRQSG
jgi:hypothetical protein